MRNHAERIQVKGRYALAVVIRDGAAGGLGFTGSYVKSERFIKT
jgi:hypothetical protein